MPPSLPQLVADVEGVDLQSSADEILAVREAIGFARQQLRAIEKEFNDRIIAWMQEHGDIQISQTIKLYLGRSKTYKPYKLEDAIDALVKFTNGDWERFCATLSANAIKPGAARRVLGEAFDDHFETTEKEELRVKTFDAAYQQVKVPIHDED